MFFFPFNGTGTPSISYRRNCRATWPLNNKRGELHCRKMGILDRINELWPVPVSTVCPCKYFDQGVDSTRTINRSDEIKEEPMDCKDIDVLEAPESVLIAPKVESLLEVQKCEPLDIQNVAKAEPESTSDVEIMEVDEEPLKSKEADVTEPNTTISDN